MNEQYSIHTLSYAYIALVWYILHSHSVSYCMLIRCEEIT